MTEILSCEQDGPVLSGLVCGTSSDLKTARVRLEKADGSKVTVDGIPVSDCPQPRAEISLRVRELREGVFQFVSFVGEEK